ncbi:MAG: TIGR02646 family protein [Chloroflexi bacterium]|nr:TIGR02646 family protein [Chloroflexota bacterium]
MHWVDRGPEPEGLAAVRAHYTQRWVDHYRNGNRSKPSDSSWREFKSYLDEVFSGICAYCEELDPGEVEHFRPKSRFPELVYDWANWVFACHNCNYAKLEKWPSGGYVDSCAKSKSARPENFFDFDTLTGEIVPKQGLSQGRHKKAVQMIADLRLNDFHHLRARRMWVIAVSQALSNPGPDEDSVAFVELVTNRGTQFSSITRVLLAELGVR